MLDFNFPFVDTISRNGITCFKCDSSVDVGAVNPNIDYCFCQFECEDPLIQFAGNEEREKDYFTLYHKSLDEQSTVNFFINDIALLDGIHGKSIPNGFEVDFTKIYDVLGGGDYTLKSEVVEFSIDRTKTWGKFRVVPFNLQRANGTFKMESFQTGSIENSFDFENENVKFSLRLNGILTNKTRVVELLDTPSSRRKDVQVHDRWWYEYDLIFDSNKYDFVSLIFDNMAVGTEIFISDYNLENQTKSTPYNKIPLRLIESESEHIKGTNTTKYTVKFRDSLRNGIKHPFIDC